MATQNEEEERRRAEEALRSQSEWLRVTLASIGDAVISTDGEGRITFMNGVAEELTGWPLTEALERPLPEVFHIVNEQSRLPVENPATRALREGTIVGLANHTVLITKDGLERPIDDSASPIRDPEGIVAGCVLIFRDVTEQRQVARALEQSEARKTAIVQTALDAIITCDDACLIIEFNPAAERMFLFGRDEVMGRDMAELIIPPRLRERHRRGVARYLATGEGPILNRRTEMNALRSDGSEFPAELAITRISAEGPPMFTAHIRDITERKRAEETTRFLASASAALAELTDYESTLQRIAGLAVPFFADWCAVDMLDADGSIRRLAVTHIDPAKVALAHELHRRYPPDPSDPQGAMNVLRTGKSEWAALIPQAALLDMIPEGDEELARIVVELGLRSYICVALRSRGQSLGVLTFVMAESGRAYDSTDLVAAEDLAHRAVIAIENASFLTALKESDRRKDEFLAMLAHELRNPLAPIQNAVQVIRRTETSPSQMHWATDVIDRQVLQMTRLVDDLLDVSRITRGKIEIRKESVELATVLNMAIEANRPLIERWDHDLSVSIPPEPILLDADPTRLEQILLNLLNNAAKYMDPNGRIWLTAERQADQVLIRVKDTGIGISAEMLPRVFDMFTQVDRSLERAEGGLGIGLPLVKQLAEMHGGTVEAKSDGPGQGSEFVVRLPLGVEAKHPATLGNAGAGEVPVPATCRILVVDDNRDAADSLGMLLRMLGHEVVTAHDGLEAVSAAATFQPDVVLLDIGLPKLNGYDAARQIRAQAGGAGVILVALTGWGQEEDRRRSTEAGFDHHMTKPVEFEVLHKVLAESKAGR